MPERIMSYEREANLKLEIKTVLTLSPPNKLLYAKFLACYNFQSASMSLIVGKNVI